MNNKLVVTYSSSNLNPINFQYHNQVAKQGSNPYKLAKVQIRELKFVFKTLIKSF